MIDQDLALTPVRSAVRRLSQQYRWHLLSEEEWINAVKATDGNVFDEKSARRACLTIYAQELYKSCQEAARCEQAYRELYDYLWPQAYYRTPQWANDATQVAIELIFRSFQESHLKKCVEPKAFLYFAQCKLKDAIGRVTKQYSSENNSEDSSSEQFDETDHPLEKVPDSKLTPEEQILEDEANQERSQWRIAAIQRVALEVVQCLQELWKKKRMHRQLKAVIFTFMDRLSDLEIASRLETVQENVEVLRSRGLDKLREGLRQRLLAARGS